MKETDAVYDTIISLKQELDNNGNNSLVCFASYQSSLTVTLDCKLRFISFQMRSQIMSV